MCVCAGSSEGARVAWLVARVAWRNPPIMLWLWLRWVLLCAVRSARGPACLRERMRGRWVPLCAVCALCTCFCF